MRLWRIWACDWSTPGIELWKALCFSPYECLKNTMDTRYSSARHRLSRLLRGSGTNGHLFHIRSVSALHSLNELPTCNHFNSSTLSLVTSITCISKAIKKLRQRQIYDNVSLGINVGAEKLGLERLSTGGARNSALCNFLINRYWHFSPSPPAVSLIRAALASRCVSTLNVDRDLSNVDLRDGKEQLLYCVKKGLADALCNEGRPERVGSIYKKEPPKARKATGVVWNVVKILKKMAWGSDTAEALVKLHVWLAPHHVSQVLKDVRDVNLAFHFFNWAKTQLGYSHDALNYNMMIGLLATCENLVPVINLLEEMQAAGHPLNASTFMTIMVHYDKANRVQEAYSLFDRIELYGLKPNVGIYTCMIDLLARRGLHERARIVYEQMQDSRCELDATAYNVLMRAFGRAQKVDLVCKLFRQLQNKGLSPDAGSYGFLIAALGKAGQACEALQQFHEMMEKGLNPNLPTCNILIDSLGKSQKMDLARKIFDEMLGKGPQPDAVTYNTLFYSYGKLGQVNEAYKLYKEMTDRGVCPNAFTCSILVDSLCKAGKWENAQELFLEIKNKQGVRYDVVTYNILLNRLGKAGRIGQVRQLFHSMKVGGHEPHELHKPDLITYNTVIDALCKGLHFKKANQVLNEMKIVGCPPDVVTYNSLIHCLGKEGKVARAAKLFKEMSVTGLQPDVISYNILINALGKAQKVEEALSLYKDMQAGGLTPDVVTYNRLIDSLGKTGEYKAASKLFQDMQDKGITPDKITYTVLINGFANKGKADAAWKLYQEMKNSGYTPDVITFNCLILAFVREGRITEANELLIRMKGCGCKPTAITYGILIDANARDANDDMVYQLRKERNDAGFRPEWAKI